MSGTFDHTVYLSDFATQNPFTVSLSGLVAVANGYAIVGTAGYAWTVFNRGTVASSSAGGIDLTAGGLVVNGQSGGTGAVAAGAGYGISIAGTSGTAVNFGTVAGGISINGLAAIAKNSGTISSAGNGIVLDGKKRAQANNTGVIAAGGVGVNFCTAAR
jgi:hypothetical protein